MQLTVEILGSEQEREKKPESKGALNSIWQQQVRGKLRLPHQQKCQVLNAKFEPQNKFFLIHFYRNLVTATPTAAGEQEEMKHFSENVKIRQTCVNQAVFKSSSFVLPCPVPRIRRVPSVLWQQEYSKEKYNCFSQKFSQVKCTRALRKQHLPILKKLKVVLLPKVHIIPPYVSSGFFLNHCYLQLYFWVIKSHYSPFAL